MPRKPAITDPAQRWTTIGVPVRQYQKEHLERYAETVFPAGPGGRVQVGSWARGVLLGAAPPVMPPAPAGHRRADDPPAELEQAG